MFFFLLLLLAAAAAFAGVCRVVLTVVIAGAAAAGGRLFVGDLRSQRHLRHFHAAVQLHKLSGGAATGATASTLRGALELALLEETELCVDADVLLRDAPTDAEVDQLAVQAYAYCVRSGSEPGLVAALGAQHLARAQELL